VTELADEYRKAAGQPKPMIRKMNNSLRKAKTLQQVAERILFLKSKSCKIQHLSIETTGEKYWTLQMNI